MKENQRKTEALLRRQMVFQARSLFARGYTFGSASNLSVRQGNRILISPTGCSFETLTPAAIAKVDLKGRVVGRNQPSKELPFHLAIYRARPDTGAVVHLHSTYAVALSCLRDLDFKDALDPLTPYYVMRVGRLPVVDYYPPGDSRLGGEVEDKIRTSQAVLLRNHGPITIGRTLEEAVHLAEELEEQAKLHILLGSRGLPLSAEAVQHLRNRGSRK